MMPSPTAGAATLKLAPLLRWFVAAGTLTVPQAAGPVAFSMVALAISGDASRGAPVILAMTIAQVAGAVPITRLGRTRHAAAYFCLLVGFRTLALSAMILCAHLQAPLAALIACGAFAGLVNGAAYGYLRSLLNSFVEADRLPRALGIAATINEVTFVMAPVLASVLGGFSPVLALVAVTFLGAVPAIALPNATFASPAASGTLVSGGILSPSILLWLTCATAGGATVAAIEIGAVALAVSFGYPPTLAILFTVPLCLASVAGGLWVSVRNKMLASRTIVALLGVMAAGATLVAAGQSLSTTMVGAVVVGAVLAPLGTYYALVLESLAPPHRRPEVFALLRTANAIGVIVASAVMTMASLGTALIVVAALMISVTFLALLATSSR